MSFWKVKLRSTDKLFSLYIRTRDNWTCQFCHRDFSEKKGGLDCSHYWTRGRENTRFDPENCIALCKYHHDKLGHGDGRDDYKKLMLERLGQEELDKLDIRAYTYKKRDDILDKLCIKELLKEVT